MNPWHALARLHDLDLLRDEMADPASCQRYRSLGLEPQGAELLERARTQLHEQLDRRWVHLYERAHGRYGRGVSAVRERVCQGCYITLPTSATQPAESVSVCESCGRILCWL